MDVFKFIGIAAVGGVAGIVSGADPIASASFIGLAVLVNKVIKEVINKNTNKTAAQYDLVAVCASGAISYKIVELFVKKLSLSDLGKVVPFVASVILLNDNINL